MMTDGDGIENETVVITGIETETDIVMIGETEIMTVETATTTETAAVTVETETGTVETTETIDVVVVDVATATETKTEDAKRRVSKSSALVMPTDLLRQKEPSRFPNARGCGLDGISKVLASRLLLLCKPR